MGNRPVILQPVAKDYLWGGVRLNDDFNLGMPVSPFAEAWMCSTHPDGVSFVPGLNCSLSSLLAEYPEYLGTHPISTMEGKPELPILIKLIDAKKKLSIQVHPGDEYARRVEQSLGKTEMWYVLNACPGATLVYGFREDMKPEDVRAAVRDGNIEKYLNYIPVHKDDIFFIEPGTVHAVGAGCLIAEIQESSNVTYRLYDYDRVDKNGKKRELHIEKALDVANLSNSISPRQPMRVLKYSNGSATELLTRCKYFQVERLLLNTENRNLAEFQTGANSFHSLLCVEGCGVLYGDDVVLPFFKGDCVFVPAESVPLRLHGKAQLLNVSC